MPIKSIAPSMITAGGRIICNRCRATSKRTQQQCQAPAMSGKSVCRNHGGKSTGPKTIQGRQRCAEAKTVHGRETRAIRKERIQKLAELHALVDFVNSIGLLQGKATLKSQRSSEGKKPSKLLGFAGDQHSVTFSRSPYIRDTSP